MQAAVVTLFLIPCVLCFPSAEKRRLDPDAIMADVYSNNRAFADLDFKLSPDLYDDVLAQFQRLERDFPDVPEEEPPAQPKVLTPAHEEPLLFVRPPVFPKVKSRFFRMF